MFGLAVDKKPMNEKSPFYPRSPYGAAKLYSHWITINYREAYGIFACSGILFNHESPRRGETFVTRKIVRGAARIAAGIDKTLYLGNLDAVRDWGHAKDYVEGMWRILQHKTAEEWVLASGEAITVREFVEKTFKKLEIRIAWSGSGIDEVATDESGNAIVKIDPAYFRPTEVPFLLGDASKAKKLLGWKPEYTIDSLISEMVESELKELGNQK